MPISRCSVGISHPLTNINPNKPAVVAARRPSSKQSNAWFDRAIIVLERRETRIVDAVLGEFRGQEREPACVQGGPQAPRVALGVRHVRKSGEKSCTGCLTQGSLCTPSTRSHAFTVKMSRRLLCLVAKRATHTLALRQKHRTPPSKVIVAPLAPLRSTPGIARRRSGPGKPVQDR